MTSFEINLSRKTWSNVTVAKGTHYNHIHFCVCPEWYSKKDIGRNRVAHTWSKIGKPRWCHLTGNTCRTRINYHSLAFRSSSVPTTMLLHINERIAQKNSKFDGWIELTQCAFRLTTTKVIWSEEKCMWLNLNKLSNLPSHFQQRSYIFSFRSSPGKLQRHQRWKWMDDYLDLLHANFSVNAKKNCINKQIEFLPILHYLIVLVTLYWSNRYSDRSEQFVAYHWRFGRGIRRIENAFCTMKAAWILK